MNRILLFCALGALWGCRQAAELSGEAITLSCSTSESSKVGALTAGDEVAVFARLDGTETYFLEGAKYVVGSDGHSLTYGSTVYYPDTKQAVNFYAYFPYHTGTFSVPSDQSTAAALKQADLCWATASTTPVATPVSLTFQHLFARLIVQTNEPTEKVACLVVPSGTLNPTTGQFTLNSTKSEVSTTGSELIVPVQPLSRLVLTVSNIEYVFEGSINLQPGQTTTLNLTLNATNKTATLKGSSNTKWTISNQQGTPEQTVSNLLTLHYPNVLTGAPSVNKIILTIKDETANTTADYIVASGIAFTNSTFTIPFSSLTLSYPYTITKICYYDKATEILPSTHVFSGPTVYKSGAYTLGVKRNPINTPGESDYMVVNGLRWAKGNLIATSPTSSGMNGCKIGKPEDGGLYFQFGSLIGWRGGSESNGGTGEGTFPSAWERKSWGGRALSWSNDGIVWPSCMLTYPNSWPSTVGSGINTLNNWHFNYSIDVWSTLGSNIRNFAALGGGNDGSLGTGKYASLGVGDACTYYLGEPWRMPTYNELSALVSAGRTGITTYGGSQGIWLGPSAGNSTTSLWFTANGYRRTNLSGALEYTSTSGVSGVVETYLRIGEVYSSTDQRTYMISSYSGQLFTSHPRGYAYPIRCVSSI